VVHAVPPPTLPPPTPAPPGEEEIPEGCVAVLTPDAPDVLSHVSVRARNMKVRSPQRGPRAGSPTRASPLSGPRQAPARHPRLRRGTQRTPPVRRPGPQVLFATCHDEQPLDDIKAAAGQYLHFKTTAAGAVTWVSPSLM
jgi:alpha-glucan,water dikinase